ncbi:hypothetical protein EBX31_10620 [bacterium]|nr:hypothetical protein [bacterium]
MSTDTDYIITIKGKDAALRKAAADYIELILQPWNPQRNDKKTLTRIDVFRNESNARGLLARAKIHRGNSGRFPVLFPLKTDPWYAPVLFGSGLTS